MFHRIHGFQNNRKLTSWPRPRYLEDNTSKEVFESAHSVMLARLSRTSPSSPDETERLVLTYCDSLIRVRASCSIQPNPFRTDLASMSSQKQNINRLTVDQLQHAFAILFQRASSISPSVVETALYNLQAAFPPVCPDPSSLPTEGQPILSIYVSLLPHIPTCLLGRFLVETEQVILMRTAPRTKEREGIVHLVWKGVSKGLGDEGKEIGVRWWLDVERRLKKEERMGSGGAMAML